MTATSFDQITMLERAPTRIAGDEYADPLPNVARGGYRRRKGDVAFDVEPARPSADPPLRHTPASPTDAEPRRRDTSSYLAAIVDIAPVLPMVGTIATVFAYVGGPTPLASQLNQIPLVIGAAATVILGLAVACLHRSLFTAPEQAHPRSFAEIRQRVDTLAAHLGVLDAELTPETPASQRLAFREALAHYRTLERDLARGGPQWVLGTGYVDAMTRLHRAEEALISVQPTTDVLAGALFDELRIAGSTLADREHLLGKLRTAVQALWPAATAYLNEPSSGRTRPTSDAQPADARQALSESAQGPWAEIEARIVLREVRRALNDFRDESRARLIRSRSRLLGTMTMTGAITYVLLAFAVNLEEDRVIALNNPVVAAAAIYLVGAVVGLFNRLHLESGDDAAGEDYGLSKTRLLLTPMLSGLAAVGGVLITGMLSGIVDVRAITPTPAVDPDLLAKALANVPEAGMNRVGLSLRDIFNLQAYPFSLVLAAMFGLAPKTFLKRLHQAGEQSKLNLKSTAASHPATGGRSGGAANGTN